MSYQFSNSNSTTVLSVLVVRALVLTVVEGLHGIIRVARVGAVVTAAAAAAVVVVVVVVVLYCFVL